MIFSSLLKILKIKIKLCFKFSIKHYFFILNKNLKYLNFEKIQLIKKNTLNNCNNGFRPQTNHG